MVTSAPRTSRSAASPRTISILGATGSIGTSTLDLLVRQRDRYSIEAVASQRNVEALAKTAIALGARFAAVAEPDAYGALKDALSGSNITAAAGADAVIEAAERPADLIVASISGAAGLAPTMAAIERGTSVAIANKECLVCAGGLFMRRAAEKGVTILPVDSEHNALFQAMAAGERSDVRRLILTASGGPFRTWTAEAVRNATPEQALRHPNWSMGAKVTIDSATLMNKGLELIEAHHLFQMPASDIDVFVHPQSIVHGIVEFRDGSFIAQLGAPDMRIPISHCLAWPERMDEPARRLRLEEMASLTFEAPDLARFPALRLAREAIEEGGAAPTILNAANEVAVAEFLAGRLGFASIPSLVDATLNAAAQRGIAREPTSVEEALAIDRTAREIASTLKSSASVGLH
ncbi:1-deoxy-D-xylulose-5-phosphate reductoisomerase [Pseudorhodoplanes sp.]|uniref:1-deoxy-D-xylulose-5-phosphate reductoisomerase n=1 Tax=Pseudorhodoplanes sp. TaxID=1934341 RepID=UPI002CA7DD84|nr:1-deoxy-D-xylulose-5-phosphate reductoisomerase [Pseudorhodoplanes sp.]HWV54879.1 1-deoxy-D-xylulose-5-phosphate reductoisomerase [Pseudorhodoplanes sp.]